MGSWEGSQSEKQEEVINGYANTDRHCCGFVQLLSQP